MPENHISYQEKLLLLRQEIKNQGLLGFIVPHADEFQGENIAPYAERLAWLTGFTGSAGAAMILNDSAVVMSDGRYTLQLRQQVDKTLYALENSMDMPLGEWIALEVQKRSCTDPRIGYDPWLHTIKQIEVLEKQAKEINNGTGIQVIFVINQLFVILAKFEWITVSKKRYPFTDNLIYFFQEGFFLRISRIFKISIFRISALVPYAG